VIDDYEGKGDIAHVELGCFQNAPVLLTKLFKWTQKRVWLRPATKQDLLMEETGRLIESCRLCSIGVGDTGR
jgi:hypothetical protein